MILNGVTAFILLYFTEFDSFAGLLRHYDTEYCLRFLAKTDPPCSAVSAMPELPLTNIF